MRDADRRVARERLERVAPNMGLRHENLPFVLTESGVGRLDELRYLGHMAAILLNEVAYTLPRLSRRLFPTSPGQWC